MRYLLPAESLGRLFAELQHDGRRLIGPTVRDGAIVLDELESVADLPRGQHDQQAPGHYRLADAHTPLHFDHTVGPQSAKRWLHPPTLRLFRARKAGASFTVEPPAPPPPIALLGARACDLAAIAVQDRVFMGDVTDPHYASRRSHLLVVAVQCTRSNPTCFCPSMGTGPRVTTGFDLCLTELDAPHRFILEVGSPAGRAIVDRLHLPPAGADASAPEAAAARTEAAIEKRLNTVGLKERLRAALDSPAWDDVAQRCLGCANCTMVCPTCFCTTVDDLTTLDGHHDRIRRWDSCFTPESSHVHGHGPVRAELKDRYRQWLTHKLSTWHDQFDTSGCVGCGRCITWCPAGIDIVAEAERATEAP